MKGSLPANPVTARALMAHLSTWGEVSECELTAFQNGAQWLKLLKESGLIQQARAEQSDGSVWMLTPRSDVLLDVEAESALKLALFQIPTYRHYLLGIIAEGLVLAAKYTIL